MRGSVLLRVALAFIIVVSAVQTIGPVTVTPFSFAAHPCVSDSECPGSQICCPISGACTPLKGCRRDPR